VSGQGTAQWARKAGGTGDDYAHSVAVTATGAVVVVGRTSSATLHCQELRVARASEPFESYADPEDAMDAFTLSLDGNGMPTWGRADGGRNHDSARVRAHLRPPLRAIGCRVGRNQEQRPHTAAAAQLHRDDTTAARQLHSTHQASALPAVRLR